MCNKDLSACELGSNPNHEYHLSLHIIKEYFYYLSFFRYISGSGVLEAVGVDPPVGLGLLLVTGGAVVDVLESGEGAKGCGWTKST